MRTVTNKLTFCRKLAQYATRCRRVLVGGSLALIICLALGGCDEYNAIKQAANPYPQATGTPVTAPLPDPINLAVPPGYDSMDKLCNGGNWGGDWIKGGIANIVQAMVTGIYMSSYNLFNFFITSGMSAPIDSEPVRGAFSITNAIALAIIPLALAWSGLKIMAGTLGVFDPQRALQALPKVGVALLLLVPINGVSAIGYIASVPVLIADTIFRYLLVAPGGVLNDLAGVLLGNACQFYAYPMVYIGGFIAGIFLLLISIIMFVKSAVVYLYFVCIPFAVALWPIEEVSGFEGQIMSGYIQSVTSALPLAICMLLAGNFFHFSFGDNGLLDVLYMLYVVVFLYISFKVMSTMLGGGVAKAVGVVTAPVRGGVKVAVGGAKLAAGAAVGAAGMAVGAKLGLQGAVAAGAVLGQNRFVQGMRAGAQIGYMNGIPAAFGAARQAGGQASGQGGGGGGVAANGGQTPPTTPPPRYGATPNGGQPPLAPGSAPAYGYPPNGGQRPPAQPAPRYGATPNGGQAPPDFPAPGYAVTPNGGEAPPDYPAPRYGASPSASGSGAAQGSRRPRSAQASAPSTVEWRDSGNPPASNTTPPRRGTRPLGSDQDAANPRSDAPEGSPATGSGTRTTNPASGGVTPRRPYPNTPAPLPLGGDYVLPDEVYPAAAPSGVTANPAAAAFGASSSTAMGAAADTSAQLGENVAAVASPVPATPTAPGVIPAASAATDSAATLGGSVTTTNLPVPTTPSAAPGTSQSFAPPTTSSVPAGTMLPPQVATAPAQHPASPTLTVQPSPASPTLTVQPSPVYTPQPPAAPHQPAVQSAPAAPPPAASASGATVSSASAVTSHSAGALPMNITASSPATSANVGNQSAPASPPVNVTANVSAGGGAPEVRVASPTPPPVRVNANVAAPVVAPTPNIVTPPPPAMAAPQISVAPPSGPAVNVASPPPAINVSPAQVTSPSYPAAPPPRANATPAPPPPPRVTVAPPPPPQVSVSVAPPVAPSPQPALAQPPVAAAPMPPTVNVNVNPPAVRPQPQAAAPSTPAPVVNVNTPAGHPVQATPPTVSVTAPTPPPAAGASSLPRDAATHHDHPVATLVERILNRADESGQEQGE